jgi:hypothetical protein
MRAGSIIAVANQPDIRECIQMEADELAFKLYEADFYDLTKELQAELYSRAMQKINDEIMDAGMNEFKKRKEFGL